MITVKDTKSCDHLQMVPRDGYSVFLLPLPSVQCCYKMYKCNLNQILTHAYKSTCNLGQSYFFLETRSGLSPRSAGTVLADGSGIGLRKLRNYQQINYKNTESVKFKTAHRFFTFL